MDLDGNKDSDYDEEAGSSGEKEKQTEQDKIECAVCLQPCVQPVQLPCKHIFCYLCVKGVTHQSKRCAMCRQEIPSNYLDNPCLVAAPDPSPVAFEGSYQWFYEGRNGWWQYDERTSVEIENAYKAEKKQCEVLIAGFLYVIDFDSNVQYRRCDPSRRRKIKRDLVSAAKKGVAGIRLPPPDEAATTLQNLNLSDSDNGSSSCCSTSKTPPPSALADNCSCLNSVVPSKRFKANSAKPPAASVPATVPLPPQASSANRSATSGPATAPPPPQSSTGTSQQSSTVDAAPQQSTVPSMQLSFPGIASMSIQAPMQSIVISVLPPPVSILRRPVGAQILPTAPVVSASSANAAPAVGHNPQSTGSASAATNVPTQSGSNLANSSLRASQRKRSIGNKAKTDEKKADAIPKKSNPARRRRKQRAVNIARVQPKRKCKTI